MGRKWQGKVIARFKWNTLKEREKKISPFNCGPKWVMEQRKVISNSLMSNITFCLQK